jgi:peptidyl-prolyl cis-trans isomerase D
MEYVYKSENERAVFEYASVKNSAVMIDSSKITDNMISKYYSAHPDTFKCDEQVDLYMVKFPKKPTAHDEELYLQELMEIKNKIMSEKGAARAEAFAEEAKGMSDDEGSAQNGGDLGFFKKGTMVPEFDSIVFKLDTGIVSNPIKTRFGYHLVFVDKKDKKGKIEQIHARHILRKIVPTIETTDALSENADSLRRTMLDEGFVKAAKEAASRDTSVIFDSTGFFQKSGIVPKAGYVSGIGRFAFGGGGRESDLISERLENSSGFYLFAVKQRLVKGIMPLEAVKPRIRQNLADSMRAYAGRLYAEEWAKKVGEKSSLATLNKNDSTKIISGITDTVKRISFIPGIGADSKVAAVAFALPIGKRSGLVEYNGTYFLVRPLWKGPPVSFAWGSNQVESVAGRLISQTRERIFGDWYLDYLKKQKIISNIDKIYID